MTITPGKKRMVLTSVNQLILLAKNNDKVKNLSRFKEITAMELSTSPTKTCSCKMAWKTQDLNKQVIENTLSSFKSSDFVELRNALELDELCYYLRNRETKKLEMFCV
jgi:hypothetical protein